MKSKAFKVLALLLCLIMTVALCSCSMMDDILYGGDETTTAVPESTDTATEAPQEENSAEDEYTLYGNDYNYSDFSENGGSYSGGTYSSGTEESTYVFRNNKLFSEHFKKHGIETYSGSKEEYLEKANSVISNPKSLHKIEAEDGDDIYFLEDTNEFVVVSTDGYIRTYYICSGINYFNRQ